MPPRILLTSAPGIPGGGALLSAANATDALLSVTRCLVDSGFRLSPPIPPVSESSRNAAILRSLALLGARFCARFAFDLSKNLIVCSDERSSYASQSPARGAHGYLAESATPGLAAIRGSNCTLPSLSRDSGDEPFRILRWHWGGFRPPARRFPCRRTKRVVAGAERMRKGIRQIRSLDSP